MLICALYGFLFKLSSPLSLQKHTRSFLLSIIIINFWIIRKNKYEQCTVLCSAVAISNLANTMKIRPSVNWVLCFSFLRKGGGTGGIYC